MKRPLCGIAIGYNRLPNPEGRITIVNKCSSIIITVTSLLLLASPATIAKESPPQPEKKYRVHTESDPGFKCVNIVNRKTLRDPLNYPGAYESGYIKGTDDRIKGATMLTLEDGGEVVRGYLDGYRLKPYSGQVTTVPTENRVTCRCRTEVLKDVVFREEIEASCKPIKEEIAVDKSDAYHANAYSDGYREGTASKAKRDNYQARSAGGEFARGFEDGYFGRNNSGQRYTDVPIEDYRCDCRLILKRVNPDSKY
ncbi:hypothetical protein [Chamaesiphon sp. GL140_3_metabinner_50]|uniref:hypothetical protein n=1 Tax=Chamaesiphon sp. GL140_3_metabinner_50 TaxID=2970812 RepID=UPI0025FEA9FF|nr:hypothetical protein [Chamaesiphon sp. GL140_3_metabinner_50]